MGERRSRGRREGRRSWEVCWEREEGERKEKRERGREEMVRKRKKRMWDESVPEKE